MSIKVCETCGFILCVCEPEATPVAGLNTPDLETRAPRFGPDRCEDAVIPFGKHRNKPLAQILIDEPSYLQWVHDECKLYEPFASAFSEFYEKYLPDIEKGVETRNEKFYRQRHY